MAIWGMSSLPNNEDVMDDTNPISCFNLNRTQRLYGFGICFVAGFLISILSTLSLGTGQLALFAVFFTLGNIVSLLSTTFLIGPSKQFKTMFAPVRMVASIVFLSLIVITLIVAFTLKAALLCLILCIVQFLALFWYSASYIPYGRAAIRKVAGGCIDV
ncbi:Got1/Sft2-like family-domain-containing protein [Lobosporangium transversale]|uniref:Protein transport protein SFT2 n=1 Tax=Lobosporangium transversale TaxID=64571 RepID=A0A1Y2GJ88_9FUNG|nr:Got1/Sft2-like family-domain-containing protein [Lobosporangium transversale]ORZ09051.1 Got1/Sft2-like family-domain-containing protein [Lobosporangium transversale]|eukprot:XP_021878678.1 Got1/Sft2-like family-domain-containing protein [Lobosporangium transversale]